MSLLLFEQSNWLIFDWGLTSVIIGRKLKITGCISRYWMLSRPRILDGCSGWGRSGMTGGCSQPSSRGGVHGFTTTIGQRMDMVQELIGVYPGNLPKVMWGKTTWRSSFWPVTTLAPVSGWTRWLRILVRSLSFTPGHTYSVWLDRCFSLAVGTMCISTFFGYYVTCRSSVVIAGAVLFLLTYTGSCAMPAWESNPTSMSLPHYYRYAWKYTLNPIIVI